MWLVFLVVVGHIVLDYRTEEKEKKIFNFLKVLDVGITTRDLSQYCQLR